MYTISLTNKCQLQSERENNILKGDRWIHSYRKIDRYFKGYINEKIDGKLSFGREDSLIVVL